LDELEKLLKNKMWRWSFKNSLKQI
jgi:hypothetical protein